MLKLCEWETVDEYGKHAEVYLDGVCPRQLTKTASEEYSPEIKKFAEQVQPDPKKVVILVNAMGAGEYWGSNRNGDYFPVGALKQYHNTFYNAYPFKHHVNKDPKRAYGRVLYTVYNPRMNRVELIIEIDKEKAPDIVEKIDNGDDVSVSMGCKCDYDVCSICNKKSSKVAEYCEHLKYHMNEIYEDGHKVSAITPHPRFFDLSFVFRGADPTAKHLKKIAHTSQCVPSAVLGEHAYVESPVLEDIEKEAEAPDYTVVSFVENYLPRLERYEPDISPATLNKLAEAPFEDIFSTATAFGIVLKPKEYQRLVLVKTGRAKLADDLEAKRIFITPGMEPADKIDDEDPGLFRDDKINEKVASLLIPYLEKRSALEPYLTDRVMHVSRYNPPTNDIAESIPDPSFMSLLMALSLGYMAYRKVIPQSMMGKFDRFLAENPKVAIPILAGGAGLIAGAVDEGISPDLPEFAKTGSLMYLAPIPAAYVWQAHVKRKAERGERVGGIGLEAAKHPFATGMTGSSAMLLTALKRAKGKGSYTPGLFEKLVGGAGKGVAAAARGAGKFLKVGSLPHPDELGKLALRLGDGIAKTIAFGGAPEEKTLPPETAKEEEGSVSKGVEIVEIG